MPSHAQIKRLLSKPAEMARFQMTGKLPQGVKPTSPLITLLEKISPRDRMLLTGVVVDQRLGYAGSRSFANAERALRWAKPAPEVFGTFAAESWRLKAFNQELFLEDLVPCCSGAPEGLAGRNPLTKRPAASRRPRP